MISGALSHILYSIYLDRLRNTDDGTRCAGPCNTDDDCDGKLKCFEREGSEYVPGCVTGGEEDISGMNYCHKEPPNGKKRMDSNSRIAVSGRVVNYPKGGSSSENSTTL